MALFHDVTPLQKAGEVIRRLKGLAVKDCNAAVRSFTQMLIDYWLSMAFP